VIKSKVYEGLDISRLKMGGIGGSREKVINGQDGAEQPVRLEHFLEVSNPDVGMGETLYFSG